MPAVPPFPSATAAFNADDSDWDFDACAEENGQYVEDVVLPLAVPASPPDDVVRAAASSQPSPAAAQPVDVASAADPLQLPLPISRPPPDTPEPLRALNLYLSRAGSQLQVRAESYNTGQNPFT